jgi:hypothetical protein
MPCWNENKILFFVVFFTCIIIVLLILTIYIILVYFAYKKEKISKYQIYIDIIKSFLYFIIKIGYFPLQCKLIILIFYIRYML